MEHKAITTKAGKRVTSQEHHQQLEICDRRPLYRQGQKLTAVKVYSINDESTHILIFGVPSLKLLENVKRTCSKFGIVKSVNIVECYPQVEEFTDVFHIHYLKLSSARFAKRKLDLLSYFGHELHVCYAPEMETLQETKAKLVQRRKEVHFKLSRLKGQEPGDSSLTFSKKSKVRLS